VGGHAEYPAFQNDFGRAYMIKAGKGHGPDWLMFQHDLHRQSSLCVDTTTSVNEITGQLSVSIFPNPATEKVTINLGKAGRWDVGVWNVVGECVKVLPLNPLKGTTASIDVSGLKAGIYFVAVTDDAGNKAVRKVVKM
ncbi:MAG: T9SS type A sorting domain-containing protein, partial [Bacteroidia bacterium]|nr:T9SS type A sorting domain-containing protein [Bacteroidia bacterium]